LKEDGELTNDLLDLFATVHDVDRGEIILLGRWLATLLSVERVGQDVDELLPAVLDDFLRADRLPLARLLSAAFHLARLTT
jgi:hypothetical protein